MLNNPYAEKEKSVVVIAAAGSGSRMGGVSKPNIKILGKTLYEYVLDAVSDSVAEGAVVVCSADNEDSLRALSGGFKKPITFVRGGSTRAESVYRGVSASGDADIICVHDCARPFLTASMLDASIGAAIASGAACYCSAVTDTLKYRDIQTGEISTPRRDCLFAVQTPQCFRKSLYLSAKESAGDSYTEYTDETSLLESIGTRVDYLKFDSPNPKITSPSDVPVAEAIMKGIKL